MALFLRMNSGTSVSTGGVLDFAGRRAVAVDVPSSAPNTWRIQFAQSSGAVTWSTYHPSPTVDYIVQSGTVRPAVAVLERLPSPFVRLATATAVTDAATVTLLPVV